MSLLILRFMFVKKHSGSFYYGNLHINQVPTVMVQILELTFIFFKVDFILTPFFLFSRLFMIYHTISDTLKSPYV